VEEYWAAEVDSLNEVVAICNKASKEGWKVAGYSCSVVASYFGKIHHYVLFVRALLESDSSSLIVGLQEALVKLFA